MINVRIVQQESEFAALAADWDRLAGDRFFCRHGWLSAWWKFYGRGNQLLILVAESNGRIVGIAPFYRTNRAATGKCICFLGSNDVCSDYLKIMIDESLKDESAGGGLSIIELRRAVVEAFTGKLIEVNRQSTTRWDMLELSGALRDEPANDALFDSMQAAGCGVHHQTIECSWQLPLPATWDELNAKHGGSFRRTLKKIDRDLLDTGTVKRFEATDSETLSRGFDILVDLHQRRRESLGERGCFSDPRFTGFLKTIATDSLQRGELSLLWSEYESEPMSATICFRHSGVVSMYQSGVNPDLMQYRPGHLQNLIAIRDGISHHMKTYDFLRGDEPYKRLWRATPVELVSTRIIAGRFLPRLRHQAWVTRHAIGGWVKSATAGENAG